MDNEHQSETITPTKPFTKPARTKGVWSVGALAVLVLLALFAWRGNKGHAKTESVPYTAPAVAVARVSRRDLYNELDIPAEFHPYQQVELHAKVSGYLVEINVDIGDHVKAGQLLARLEVPEAKDDLDNAIATEKRVQADYNDAHLIYTRLQSVEKDHPNLVAQQELDTAAAKDHTTEAAIASAKAEVEKCQTLLAYTRITAPFDGVITKRYADPGALIQAGTSSATQSLPLVRLADNSRLRLDFPVSVDFVKDIKYGEGVEVRVESLGNKSIMGKIMRSAGEVNDQTRTMITEVEVANPNFEMVPGMYAYVVLKAGKKAEALAIPTEAVGSNRKSVFMVDSNNVIQEQPITLGIETPRFYEVLGGLHENDMVVIGNHGQLHAGQKVAPKVVESLAQK
jgi:RND family efflux transporter MFP subunit